MSRVTDLIDRIYCRIDRCITPDRLIRSMQVIIDRARYTHRRNIPLIIKFTSPKIRTVPTNNDKTVYLMTLKRIDRFLLSLFCTELRRPCGLKDSTTSPNDT